MSYPIFWSRAVLHEEYIVQGQTVTEIAAKYEKSSAGVVRAMQRFGIPARSKAARDQRGTRNPNWGGNAVGYFAHHKRVRKIRGTPQHCEDCGTTDPTKHYDWANLTGQFENASDYRRVCKSCHAKRDGWGRNLCA